MKSQMKKADKSGAGLALILGEDEISKKSLTIKSLRTKQEQIVIKQENMAEQIRELLA